MRAYKLSVPLIAAALATLGLFLFAAPAAGGAVHRPFVGVKKRDASDGARTSMKYMQGDVW